MNLPEDEKRAGDPDEVDEGLRNDPVIDGRIVIGRANDHDENEPLESPEHDAEVQKQERGEG